MPTIRLLGLFDSLLSMQRVPGRDPGWSLRPDSSSVAGRRNLCSSCWRQRIPLKSKTSAPSSLRRKCRLQLMLLVFELINKCRNRRKRLWQGGLDSVQLIAIDSENRDSTHRCGSLLLAFGRAYCRITQLRLKFPCASGADVFSQMLNEMHPVLGFVSGRKHGEYDSSLWKSSL